MRRASVETLEKLVQTKADQARERRLSLTMMNCIWARNTERETTHPVCGDVIVAGEIPEWLSGTLYRVGPGVLQSGETMHDHLFDMPSVLHKYDLMPAESRFTYRNRIVSLSSAAREPPFGGRLRRLRAFFGGRKATAERSIDNVCFLPSDEALYLVADASVTHRVDADSLETIDEVSVSSVSNVLVWGSHPIRDEEEILWNLGISHDSTGGFYYSVLKFGRERVVEAARVACRRKDSPCYMHSFGITASSVVVLEQPLFIAQTATNGLSLHHHLRWKGHLPLLIHLCGKSDGSLVKYACAPFFFFHVINAYDADQAVVVDVMAYKNADIIKALRFCHIERTDRVPTAQAMRLILPLRLEDAAAHTTVTVKAEPLAPEPMDFPWINPNWRGKNHRFVYAVGKELLHPSRIYKVDLETRDVQSWKEPGMFVSEPIFVARPHAIDEEDGVLCVTLLGTASQNNVALVILRANDLSEVARIKFATEGSVAQAMHGIFVPDG